MSDVGSLWLGTGHRGWAAVATVMDMEGGGEQEESVTKHPSISGTQACCPCDPPPKGTWVTKDTSLAWLTHREHLCPGPPGSICCISPEQTWPEAGSPTHCSPGKQGQSNATAKGNDRTWGLQTIEPGLRGRTRVLQRWAGGLQEPYNSGLHPGPLRPALPSPPQPAAVHMAGQQRPGEGGQSPALLQGLRAPGEASERLWVCSLCWGRVPVPPVYSGHWVLSEEHTETAAPHPSPPSAWDGKEAV